MQQAPGLRDQRANVAGIHEEAVFTVPDDFRNSSHTGCDDGEPEGHCIKQGGTQPFMPGRKHEYVQRGQVVRNVIHETDELNVAKPRCRLSHAFFVLTAADEQKTGAWLNFFQPPRHLDDVELTFVAVVECADMTDQDLARIPCPDSVCLIVIRLQRGVRVMDRLAPRCGRKAGHDSADGRRHRRDERRPGIDVTGHPRRFDRVVDAPGNDIRCAPQSAQQPARLGGARLVRMRQAGAACSERCRNRVATDRPQLNPRKCRDSLSQRLMTTNHDALTPAAFGQRLYQQLGLALAAPETPRNIDMAQQRLVSAGRHLSAHCFMPSCERSFATALMYLKNTPVASHQAITSPRQPSRKPACRTNTRKNAHNDFR